MYERGDNLYKVCRKMAKMTREHASERLCVAPRTLAGYEDDRCPPDDVIVKMSEVYRSPLLIIRHLKENSPFGDFLPEITRIKTPWEMGFLTDMSIEWSYKAGTIARRIFSNGKLEAHEREEFNQYKALIDNLLSALFSIKYFAIGLTEESDKTGALAKSA